MLETRIWQRKTSPSGVESTPSKRYLHSATYVNNSIYVYGGKSGDQYFDDMYILEISLFFFFSILNIFFNFANLLILCKRYMGMVFG